MKRFAFLAALLLVPIAAQAFDPDKPQTIRIGVLRDVTLPPDRHGSPVRAVPAALRDELRRAGFDAFTIATTLEALEQREERDADFYIEVEAADHFNNVHGGIDVYGRNGGVNVGVVETTVAARINVYDAQTLDLFASFDLDKSKTMVAPTGIGLGSRNIGVFIGVPLGYFQYRSVAKSVAKSAAAKVADAVREQ